MRRGAGDARPAACPRIRVGGAVIRVWRKRKLGARRERVRIACGERLSR